MATIVLRKVRPGQDIVNVTKRVMPVIIKQAGDIEDRLRIKLPFAPVEVTYGDYALEYATVRRPGLAPIVEAVGYSPRTVEMNILMADKSSGGTKPVGGQLEILRKMSRQDRDLKVVYGAHAIPFFVRLAQLTITSVRRNENGGITQAQVRMRFSERPKYWQKIIELEAIEYEPTVTPSGTAPPKDPEDEDDIDYEAAVYQHLNQPYYPGRPPFIL